jgi:hypothetical protein
MNLGVILCSEEILDIDSGPLAPRELTPPSSKRSARLKKGTTSFHAQPSHPAAAQAS